MRVLSLASLNGLRIHHCRELWCRSQIPLGAQVAMAVAQAGSYSSDSTDSTNATLICQEHGPKKEKKKRKDVKHGRSLKSVRRNFSLLDSLFGLKVSLLLSYYYVLDTARCLPDYIS